MTTTTETKLCVDCKYYRAGEKELFDRCAHPAGASGFVREVAHNYCMAMRCHPCGKDAKLFEAKDAGTAESSTIFVDRSHL